jgi:hypothetical protein
MGRLKRQAVGAQGFLWQPDRHRETAALKNAAGEKFSMSVFSRGVFIGLACASLVSVQLAPTAALAQGQAQAKDSENGHTGGRLLHAGKCLTTFGFGRDCDKDEAVSQESRPDKKAEREAAVTKVSTNTGERAQLAHASKCVISFGFGGGCDKKAPYGTTENPKDAPRAGPDTSTQGRFFQAAKCVTSFGLREGCDKGDSH